MKVIPLILCGGSGQRLWPLSTSSKPKPFLQFGKSQTLLQQTLLRCRDVQFSDVPIIVGALRHQELIGNSLDESGIEANIILEPIGRNSCAAIIAGCFKAMERSQNAVVMVMAADHDITPKNEFCSTVERAVPDAQAGHLITFGIQPSEPSSQYGYILPGAQIGSGRAKQLICFKEKPDRKDAEKLLRKGYLWNSGNFLFCAKSLIEEAHKIVPEMLSCVKFAYENSSRGTNGTVLEKCAYGQCSDISIDYAIMEKTDKAAVISARYRWIDIGNWDAIRKITPQDKNGNGVVGDKNNGHFVDGKNNLVCSDTQAVHMIGVDNIIIAATGEAILVTTKKQSDELIHYVSNLDVSNQDTCENSPDYQVAEHVLNPDEKLQIKCDRDKLSHWMIVRGTVEAIGSGKTLRYTKGQIIANLLEYDLEIINPGKNPVVLVNISLSDNAQSTP